MGKILGLLVLALLGFYVAWPAYSGYQIKAALDTENAALLASKVDFDAVRVSLRPAVTVEVEKAMTTAVQQGGAENATLAAQLKGTLVPKAVDLALATLVTPESLIRIFRDGQDIRKTISVIVAEKTSAAGAIGALAGALGAGGDKAGQSGKAGSIDLGKLGGLFGKREAAAPSAGEAPAPAPAPKRSMSLANIKRFALTGPASYSVGVAKDATAAAEDVTAEIAFSGGDWRLVGVRPRIATN